MRDAPAQPAAPPAAPDLKTQSTVVVKKYANRRLYNTETSSYITLENLAEMIRAGRDFAVYDARSGDDITRGVLTQIIVEEEAKGSAMLPTTFLRQLIGFYGDSLQGLVPQYLDQAMSSFARQQQQMRQVMRQTFGSFMPAGIEEMGRQNLALMERAMSMWNPFHRPAASPGLPEGAAGAAGPLTELASLRSEVESLRAQLAIARAEVAMVQAMAPAGTGAPPAPVHPLPATAAPAPSIPASLSAASLSAAGNPAASTSATPAPSTGAPSTGAPSIGAPTAPSPAPGLPAGRPAARRPARG